MPYRRLARAHELRSKLASAIGTFALFGPSSRWTYVRAGARDAAGAVPLEPPAALSKAPFLSGRLLFADYPRGGASTAVAPTVFPVSAAFHFGGDAAVAVGRSEAALAELLAAVRAIPAGRAPRALRPGPARSDRTASAYAAQVETVRQRILAGDLFQANLSREIAVELPGATRADVTGFAERLLTRERPAFGAILQRPTQTIISASPERFFRAEPTPAGTRIIAEPIKGTRPRSTDPAEDARLAAELLASEKDRAENVMIADLVRNDLSRVCTDDSVRVERLCELRSFPQVHHLVTTVTGLLRPGLTVEDAFRAQFPCGSITGAPKLAAMDLIAELEQRERGIYCGAIGYVDDRGHADFSVAIRTATVDYHAGGATMRFGVGGGVTTLSDPEAEYAETLDKARVFLDALAREAAGG